MKYLKGIIYCVFTVVMVLFFQGCPELEQSDSQKKSIQYYSGYIVKSKTETEHLINGSYIFTYKIVIRDPNDANATRSFDVTYETYNQYWEGQIIP